jgi:hypothetical protein
MPRVTAILEQLGGRRFLAMTGSHSLVGHEGSNEYPEPTLQMIIGTHEAGWHKLRITLQSNDLYKVEFWKKTGLEMLLAQEANTLDPNDTREFTDVYFDQLQEIFTKVTGMYTY